MLSIRYKIFSRGILLKAKRKLLRYLESSPEVSFRKISYSQSGEDLIVQYIFDCIKIKRPTFLDIGAHHPYYLSNTALFYEKGCRGINIEPDPSLFSLFPLTRVEDINLNIGISEIPGENDFYIISSPTLNTFSKEEVEKYQNEGDYKIVSTLKIKTDTIINIINVFANGVFPNFLSIDAEGVDEIILKSIDFKKNSPIVICIETISFSTQGKGEKNYNIISFLESVGYLLYADTNINSIFVKKSWWVR